MRRRTIAIGDIHGCSAALQALIDVIRPDSTDTVITLGDAVNRGPDTRGVLDRLIALRDRCHLVPILGNHDQMLLDVRSGAAPIARLIAMGGAATLASYGQGRDLSLIPREHYDFLASCVDAHETESHIFTHANYAPDIPMSEQDPAMLRWASLRDTVPGPHRSGKTAIVGHSSQKGGEILDLGHLKCIDTYCHGGGWLTALEVRTGEVWQANRQGKLRRR